MSENRLARETSPYLLQHAHNPVDWYPWGAEALERARREDKPILLSIGYAACHWCHVMERESFENEEIAALMNQHFVCIKVDREERPDLDDVYMAATVAISGSGGWPMTVFLTPEQKPFFAGTYFPPEDRYGRPGFASLLLRISEIWKSERAGLETQALELTEHVRDQSTLARKGSVPADAIAEAVEELSAAYDPRWGGFGGAPKFPPCAALSLLLRHHARTGASSSLEMVRGTLDGMKNGGIYDQIGGGFARYSTDERWLAPHFEKMLYDNAELAHVYLEAFQVTADPEYARIARETLDYVIREMQSPDGGYYSATDADSEGEEGKFFVWQPAELREVLGEALAERVAARFDVSERGNWEGKSILWTPKPLDEVAQKLGIGVAELEASVAEAKPKLYAARKQRVPPLLDDKVLVAWNGLMLRAMAEGHRVLGDRRYLESAERAARFVLERMSRPDGGLYRTARGDKAHLDAYLEDYAYFGDALLDLYETSGEPKHLSEAARLAERILADFADDESGAFFFTAHQHEALIARTREGHDGPIPNPNAVAARLLARLSLHLDKPEWRARAEAAIAAYGRVIERSPRAFSTALAVADFLLEPPVELVLVGREREAFERELARHYLPNRVIALIDPEREATTPLAAGKTLVDGRAALYVCRNYACQKPITDPGATGALLGEHASAAHGARKPSVGGGRLEGHASDEGTRAYAEKHGERWGEAGYTLLGTTGLTVSRLGFGGYRVDRGAPEHRGALAKSLLAGCNLIDTSTNYSDGESERLIGEVLADLIGRGMLWRDQLVVVSKIGYAQGRNLELAEEREKSGRPFPEMVKVGQGIWHCIHPEWLDDQLTRSLDRLGLDTLDICLLHNPEYFLTDAAKRGSGSLEAQRDELYRRIEAAFRHFEAEVARGRIRHYGVSSNSFVEPADDREATSLGRMLEAARAAGGEQHHFRVIQLPMNLLEPGALLEKNHDGKCVLDVAREAHLGVLVNRPLNAIVESGLVRLADPPVIAGAPDLDDALSELAELEQKFRADFAPKLRTGAGGPPAESLLAWADQLSRLPHAAQTLAQWNDVERQVVMPRARQVLGALDRALGSDKAWQSFKERYARALDQVLVAFRQRAAETTRLASMALHAAIDPHLPAERRGESLSKKSLFTLASTPGVSAVLVGMRRAEWVDDALPVLGWPALGDVVPVLQAAIDLQRRRAVV